MSYGLCPECHEEPLPAPYAGSNGAPFVAKRGAACAWRRFRRALEAHPDMVFAGIGVRDRLLGVGAIAIRGGE